MAKSSNSVLVILAFFAIYFIWGSTYLLNKIAVMELEPFMLASCRFTVAGLCIFILAKIMGISLRITKKQLINSVLAGILFLSVGNGLVVWALRYVDTGFAALEISSQPLIILTTVPFALLGAMMGLLISNNPFSIVSLFGFVALAGLVVNDAIILVDFINNRRQKKGNTVYQLWRSIINAGRLRLRPVILTSVTTIFGLVPMAFGLGGSSEMWAPLANVILFGLLVSTALTLMVIPALVAILDDLKKSRKKARMAFQK